VTKGREKSTDRVDEGRPSTLPFNPAELMAMRVLPAQFARMMGVSKTTVTNWGKSGWIILGPDGRLDPVKAIVSVIERGGAERVRARVLRQVAEIFEQRVAAAERAAADLQARYESDVRAAGFRIADQEASLAYQLHALLEDRFEEAIAAYCAGTFRAWLEELDAVDVRGVDRDEFRRDFAEDQEAAESLDSVEVGGSDRDEFRRNFAEGQQAAERIASVPGAHGTGDSAGTLEAAP
jgi:hypothetical protein